MQRLEYSVDKYDLRKTIESGQAFHWMPSADDSWECAWRGDWVRVSQFSPTCLVFETDSRNPDMFANLAAYFQCDIDLAAVCESFPKDPLMQASVRQRLGLRLLRQDPWLCLASFILSSTKQITQIKAIVRLMSEQLGSRIHRPLDGQKYDSFPEPKAIVRAGESAIRTCKAGFRATYIYQCAREIESGNFDLNGIGTLTYDEAKRKLMSLSGVGPKIADCVLLFAYGFPRAFPIDVWVQRVLQDYYFGGRKVPRKEIDSFVEDYFGPNAGFAQQYLFDYIRSLTKKEWTDFVAKSPF